MIKNSITIGQAAKKANVGVETIRFYERVGLIKQPMKPKGSGFRHYPNSTIKTVHFIRQAQEVGFSLGEIKELLSLHTAANADCSEIRARAQLKVNTINARVADLLAMKTALESLIETCPGQGSLERCSILNAFSLNQSPDRSVQKR